LRTCTAREGPIVVLVEAIDELLVLLRIAERLAAATSGAPSDIVLLLASSSADPFDDLEAHVRLALVARGQAATLDPTSSVPSVTLRSLAGIGSRSVAETLVGLKPGFFVVRFGGGYLPADQDPMVKITGLSCPTFIAR
jgi:hypothetical protein